MVSFFAFSTKILRAFFFLPFLLFIYLYIYLFFYLSRVACHLMHLKLITLTMLS
jgi:hypothetical protein